MIEKLNDMNNQVNHILNLIEKRYSGIRIDKDENSARVFFHAHPDKIAKQKKAQKFYLERQKSSFDLEIYSSDDSIKISSALKDFRAVNDYQQLNNHLELIRTAHPRLSDEITYEDDSWVIYCSTEIKASDSEVELEIRLDLMLNWILAYQNWK